MERYTIEEIFDLFERFEKREDIDIGSIGYMMQHSDAAMNLRK